MVTHPRLRVWGSPGGFHALANSFAFADFCGAFRRNARGLGAIADFLPLVFAQRPVEHEQLLLHQQRAMPADDFRNWRLLLAKPLSSAFAPGPDQAVTLSSLEWRAVQLLNEPSRQVGARQSRAVRAKPSASARERPGGRLDADATGAHVPKQETLTGADVGIRLPAALTPGLTEPDVGIRPPAAPELSSPKTPE